MNLMSIVKCYQVQSQAKRSSGRVNYWIHTNDQSQINQVLPPTTTLGAYFSNPRWVKLKFMIKNIKFFSKPVGPQKLMVNLEIKVSVSPKLPEVFGVRELYLSCYKVMNQTKCLVGKILKQVQLKGLSGLKSMLWPSVVDTQGKAFIIPHFELSVCRRIFLSKYNFHNNCNNLFYIIGSLTIPTWKQLNLKVFKSSLNNKVQLLFYQYQT